MPRTDENVEKLAQMLYSVWEMYVWGCLFQCYLFFFLLWLNGKEFACYNAEDVDLIPGWGRSPGVGNGNLLQHSCLENSMDSGDWRAAIRGVTKSQRWPSDWARVPLYCTHCLSLRNAHSDILFPFFCLVDFSTQFPVRRQPFLSSLKKLRSLYK